MGRPFSACFFASLAASGEQEQQGGGHVATEAPAMYTDAVAIDVGQALEKLCTFNLVLALLNTKVAEGGVFKLQASVGTAAVVKTEDDVAAVGHIEVPATGASEPAVSDELGVRTAINVDDGGVALGGVEVGGLDQTVVEVGCAIGRLDSTSLDGRHHQVGIGISGGEQGLHLTLTGRN